MSAPSQNVPAGLSRSADLLRTLGRAAALLQRLMEAAPNRRLKALESDGQLPERAAHGFAQIAGWSLADQDRLLGRGSAADQAGRRALLATT